MIKITNKSWKDELNLELKQLALIAKAQHFTQNTESVLHVNQIQLYSDWAASIDSHTKGPWIISILNKSIL